MSQTYKVTGINLKGMPLGEADRLLTVLTAECGLVRVVAPGARKHKSALGGRSGLFVVNELLIAKGRSLDRITQAHTLESYPKLGQNLGKLTASQYLAEIVLCQALSDQPQAELYELLNEHLRRLEHAENDEVIIARLTQAVFHLLAVAGIAPQVQQCCLTQNPIIPDFATTNWQVGFSVPVGGTVAETVLQRLETEDKLKKREASARLAPSFQPAPSAIASAKRSPIAVKLAANSYQAQAAASDRRLLTTRIDATELALLQHLAHPELPEIGVISPLSRPNGMKIWLKLEKILRQYAQYHFDRSFRAAALIDSTFLNLPTSI